MEKIDKRRSIGEVAKELGLETHVIRFWESKFPQIKPQIGKGDRRYYFDKEVAVLTKIKSLLHDEGYSISGLQKLLNRRKDLRVKNKLKEQNVGDLLSAEDENNNFALDDFINPNVDLAHNSGSESINDLVAKIDVNLKRLEECLK